MKKTYTIWFEWAELSNLKDFQQNEELNLRWAQQCETLQVSGHVLDEDDNIDWNKSAIVEFWKWAGNDPLINQDMMGYKIIKIYEKK